MASLGHGILSSKKSVLERSWSSSVDCGKKCSQEEARIAAQEEKMGSEYQALTVESKKRKRSSHHPKGKHFHQKDKSVRSNKDLSKLRCYTCNERGNFAINFPMNKNGSKK